MGELKFLLVPVTGCFHKVIGAAVCADTDEDSYLFGPLKGPVDGIEPAREEIADEAVEEAGVFNQYLEAILEAFAVFVGDEGEVGRHSCDTSGSGEGKAIKSK